LIRVIFDILKALPTIVVLIKELKSLIDEYYEVHERKQAAEELTAAFKEVREKKDSRRLESFFAHLSSSGLPTPSDPPTEPKT